MSARPCDHCGKLIVFAKDRATEKWVAMTNQAPIWKSVGIKNGVPYVVRQEKMLATHYCDQPQQPEAKAEESMYEEKPRADLE